MSVRSSTGTRSSRPARAHAAEIPLRPVIWNVLGTRWILLNERDGLVTLQPIDANDTLTGKPVRLNASEWRGAQLNAYQE